MHINFEILSILTNDITAHLSTSEIALDHVALSHTILGTCM